MEFNDYFSDHSDKYKQYRPHYPGKLFQFIVSKVKARNWAWDCATGNGQVAQVLSAYFNKVIATDASKKQLNEAEYIPNVHFVKAKAEETGLPDDSMDLITVGQALHWFNMDEFFKEARRVLKKDGIIAAWTYQLCSVNEDIDRLLNTFYHEVIGPYWPDERRLVDEGYRTISFPFDELEAPEMMMEADWDLEHFLGYIRTWSAVQQYNEKNNTDPLESFTAYFKNAWGDPNNVRRVYWPINIRIGKV